MAKNDIIVKFISDSTGDRAIAKQGNMVNENVSQKAIIEKLQQSVGKGTFISGKVKKSSNGDAIFRYTLKETDRVKGTIIVKTSSKYHEADDVNVQELEAISKRGNCITYCDIAKLATTCVLVSGIVLGSLGVIGYQAGKVIEETEKARQEYYSENYGSGYVDYLNEERAKNGAAPLGRTKEEQEQFENDRKQAIEEEKQNDISFQFGDYFEEEQEKGMIR